MSFQDLGHFGFEIGGFRFLFVFNGLNRVYKITRGSLDMPPKDQYFNIFYMFSLFSSTFL